MRSDRVNYVAVGLFVIAAAVGLVAGLAALLGRTGATDPYHATFGNVTGLLPGTQVLYEGYPVGQVEEIVPVRDGDVQRFRVELRVEEGWPIPADSRAEITAPGLLAAFTLEIHGGESAERLAPGSEIPSVEPQPLYALVSSVAADLAELSETSIEPLLASLGEQGPRIAGNLEAFTERLNRLTERLETLVSEDNAGSVREILGNLESASAGVSTLTSELSDTRDALHRLVEGVETVIAESRPGIDRSLVDLQHTLESVARHVDAITVNLESTSRNLYEFSRQIRSNPGALISGEPPVDRAAADGAE